MGTTKDRLLDFLKYKNIGQGAFEKSVGLSNGYVNNLKSSPSSTSIQKIISVYSELNEKWLLTGEGEMLKEAGEQTPPEGYTTKLLPTMARGGTLGDFSVAVHEYECEDIVTPIKGVDFAITVTGDSMAPEYPSGAKILIKRINEKAFIDWGRVYVLDTVNGTVVKKIMPGKSDKSVRCVSVNPDYPDFEVRFSDMLGMYRVLMMLVEK